MTVFRSKSEPKAIQLKDAHVSLTKDPKKYQMEIRKCSSVAGLLGEIHSKFTLRKYSVGQNIKAKQDSLT